jgi:hypothetical protein
MRKEAHSERAISTNRIICPKGLEHTMPEEKKKLAALREEEDRRSREDLFRLLDLVPDQMLHFRILQLDFEAQRLVNFYLSWSVSQGYSNLPCALSWSKTIVDNAFKSQLHTLVLSCYIASMSSYFRGTPTGSQMTPAKSQQEVTRSISPSNLLAAPESHFDWGSPQLTGSPASASSLPFATPQATDLSYFDHSPGLSPGADAINTMFDYPSPRTKSPQIFQSNPLPSAPNHPERDTTFPIADDLGQLTHLALIEFQSCLSAKNKSSISPAVSSDLLFPVWCLFRAAIFQGDEFAAASHQQFLKHLVYRPEASRGCPSWIIGVIIETDLKLQLPTRRPDEQSSAAILVESELRERMDVLF